MRASLILLGCALVFGASRAGVRLRAVDGTLLSFFGASGRVNALFFVSSDCPVSNSYAPEIQRVCQAYGAKGVTCSLLYEDVGITAEAVRKHQNEYRYRGIRAAIDGARTVAKEANATVTPEAVVVAADGTVRYRGRIDNLYAALGKPRQQVTEHDLSDALDAVLAGKPVPKPETKALGCFIVDPKVLEK